MIPLLSIDTTPRVGMGAAWRLHGMEATQVYSVPDAIAALANRDFILISINEDSVAYLQHLQLLRDAALAPILVFTSRYTMQKELAAIQNGADAYTQWRTLPEDDVRFALATLHRYGERGARRKMAQTLSCRSILLAQGEHCKAFIRDTELKLTHMEFGILYQLLLHCGRIVPYTQLCENLHHQTYSKALSGKMFSSMKRLREKIAVHVDVDSYIQNVRGVGYRLIP